MKHIWLWVDVTLFAIFYIIISVNLYRNELHMEYSFVFWTKEVEWMTMVTINLLEHSVWGLHRS
jgi:hypothetical protein